MYSRYKTNQGWNNPIIIPDHTDNIIEVTTDSNERRAHLNSGLATDVTILGKTIQESTIKRNCYTEEKTPYGILIKNGDVTGLINFMQENTLDQSTLDNIILLSARFYNHDMIKYALENGANINVDNCIIINYVSFVSGTKIFDDLLFRFFHLYYLPPLVFYFLLFVSQQL